MLLKSGEFMQLNVTNVKEEPLLSRAMIEATLDFENATPSYKEVMQLIAAHLKKDEKLIVIRHIYTLFGNKKAKVVAYAYNDEGNKQRIEPKVKEKKAKEEKKEGH